MVAVLLSEVQCDTQEEEDWVYSCLETLPNGFFFSPLSFCPCLSQVFDKDLRKKELCAKALPLAAL